MICYILIIRRYKSSFQEEFNTNGKNVLNVHQKEYKNLLVTSSWSNSQYVTELPGLINEKYV